MLQGRGIPGERDVTKGMERLHQLATAGQALNLGMVSQASWSVDGPTEHALHVSFSFHQARLCPSYSNNNNNNNRIQRLYPRFFYNLLTAPRIVSNMHAQVAQAQSCANHVQHIERLSRATCSMCHLVRRDSSAI